MQQAVFRIEGLRFKEEQVTKRPRDIETIRMCSKGKEKPCYQNSAFVNFLPYYLSNMTSVVYNCFTF